MKTRTIYRIRIAEDHWRRFSNNQEYANKENVTDLPKEPLALYVATFDKMPKRRDVLEHLAELQKSHKKNYNYQNCYRIVNQLKELPKPMQLRVDPNDKSSIARWKIDFGTYNNPTHEISGTISALQFDVILLGSIIDETRISFDYRKNEILARAIIEGKEEFKMSLPINEKDVIFNWEKQMHALYLEKEQEREAFCER